MQYFHYDISIINYIYSINYFYNIYIMHIYIILFKLYSIFIVNISYTT